MLNVTLDGVVILMSLSSSWQSAEIAPRAESRKVLAQYSGLIP